MIQEMAEVARHGRGRSHEGKKSRASEILAVVHLTKHKDTSGLLKSYKGTKKETKNDDRIRKSSNIDELTFHLS